MHSKGLMRRLGAALLTLAGVAMVAGAAWASPRERVIDSFAGPNGAGPRSVLVRDTPGNFYGTTYFGGVYNFGTVFELTPISGGGWQESILYSFTGGSDGSLPWAGLTFDSAGNLYGTTLEGGAYEVGTVFELTPTSSGWNETVLYSFTGGDDGGNPLGGVILDTTGNLYGTTAAVGNGYCSGFSLIPLYKCGAVFELSPALGGGWSETTLHAFTGGKDGGQPVAGLVMDGGGNLYGTTFAGGNTACTDGCGTVFRLSPIAGGGWEGTILLNFNLGKDGAYPAGPLVLDAEGSLYGTTSARGLGNSNCVNGCGTIFKLSPSSGDKWHATVLHIFTGGADGGEPFSGLVFDAAGNLYGTTNYGGVQGCYLGCGVVFELMPTSGGWKERVLYAFEGSTDGAGPYGGVVLDDLGNIYGATWADGNGLPTAYGTVYEVIP
jgi:uncharacterized repeat protein (TIGR03803 family)